MGERNFPSSPRRGGCAVNKYCEATLARADGVVLGVASIVATPNTTPSAPQPPLLGEEGKASPT
jgi:hypothetical protein